MRLESDSVRRTRHVAPPELDRLELAVRRLLEAHDALRRRAESAEARVSELEAAVRDLASGSLDPLALSGQVDAMEAENRALRERLDSAQHTVQRILNRLQFVEEER
jgi:predicted RNase H-like nuclease (RuvC/YqgF family)